MRQRRRTGPRGPSRFSACAPSRVLPLALIASLVVAPAAAQPPDLVDKYLALVDGYCTGGREAAVREVGSWGPSWIGRGVDGLLERSGEAEGHEVAAWVRRAQVAFVLHVEETLRYPPGTGPLAGEHEEHVEAARRLMAWFRGQREQPPESRALRPRDFYIPLVAAELRAGRPDAAAELAEEALRTYERDVRMQLLAGVAAEMRSSALRVAGEGLRSDRDLARAEVHFRNVLDIDPENDAARLRLGWVLVRRKHADEARSLLEDLVRGLLDRDRLFLGLVFLGAACEGTGDDNAAIATYRRAIRVAPDGQPAHLALALVMERVAGQEAAREVIEPFFADRGRMWVRNDPWDDYLFGPTELRVAPLGELTGRLCTR